MRKGFTMIELIFVIVIIGILAAVAVPKMMATRDDAKISAEMESVAQAIKNLGAEYTAKGKLDDASVAEANSATKCFKITEKNDGNITVTLSAVSNDCPQAVNDGVKAEATKNGILKADGAAKTFNFAGSGIAR